VRDVLLQLGFVVGQRGDSGDQRIAGIDLQHGL
jgi:hypothetical protein